MLKSKRGKAAKYVTCERCGKEFLKEENQIEVYDHHYCSVECYAFAPKVVVACAQCGKEVERLVSRIKRQNRNGNTFCSKSCAAKYNNARREWSRRSKFEEELFDHLVAEFPELEILPSDKKMLDGFETDIAIPELNLAIEWNGAIHFIPMFGAGQLKQIQYRDRKKLAIASRQDINLIVIADPKCERDVLEQAKEDIPKIIRELLNDE